MRNGPLATRISLGQMYTRAQSSLIVRSRSSTQQCRLLSSPRPLRSVAAPRPHFRFSRNASTKATPKSKSKDKDAFKIPKPLAQGLLTPDVSTQDSTNSPLPPLDQTGLSPTYPTVIQQARDNMRLFSSCVLLTRVGGFYELYCEHATKYAPLLGLKVGAKSTAGAGKVPMAGFPWMHLDRYLGMLVRDHGLYVAISEEVKAEGHTPGAEGADGTGVQGLVDERVKRMEGRVRSGGNLWDRRVVRVVTRGMLVGEGWLEGGRNNWCLGVWVDEGKRKAPRKEKDVDEDEETLDDRQREAEAEDEMEQVLRHGDTVAADKLRLANAALGIAWVDLSTGEFYMQSSTLSELPSLVTRIGPKEILLTDSVSPTLRELLLDMLGPEQLLISWQPQESSKEDVDGWGPMLDSPMSEQTRLALTTEETAAGSVLMNYVRGHLLTSETKLRPPVVRRDTDNMVIDKHTIRGLEILETIRDSRAKGSLLHAVDRTVTNSGARLLRDRIIRPSTILSVINERLNLVEELLEEENLRKSLRSLLAETFDSQRLIQKFALARADADDLVSLSRTIQTTDKIAVSLSESDGTSALSRLRQRFSLEEANALSSRIANAIDEDGLLAAHEQEQDDSADVISTAQQVLAGGDLADIQALGSVARAKAKSIPQADNEETWIMRRTASPRLTDLHDELETLNEQKDDLCDQLRTKSQLKGLSLQWQPSMGYICHLKGKGARTLQTFLDACPEATVVRGLKTTSSFYIPEWSTLGKQIDHTKAAIREEEQVVFRDLRDSVVQNLLQLRRNAAILDELDVACSSATLAQEQHAVRPIVDTSTALEIVAGRHPTVVLGLEEKGRSFVSNDCFLNTSSSPGPFLAASAPTSTLETPRGERMHLITGPNMAGKSTFLRQNALLALIAQTGLFVPAAYARIGIVDALFARIGSADNLFSDQSTFMTEMLETAHILSHATSRSLVIMDEVGRGTTPQDGEAVAFASLRHLVEVNGCRGLFATHFHGVVDRAVSAGWAESGSGSVTGTANGAGSVGLYCTDIKELDNGRDVGSAAASSGGWVFLHKVRRGVNRNSHALRIAAMAGLPERAVRAAREALMVGAG